MAFYRKKPVIIEAVQFDNNYDTIMQILAMDAEKKQNRSLRYFWGCADRVAYFEVKTLEGVMKANIGDWIIKGVNGELYPCKDDVFQKTYYFIGDKKESIPELNEGDTSDGN